MDGLDSDEGAEYREPSPLPMVAITAVLGGCALLVLAGIGLPHAIQHPPTTILFGGGAAAGLLLWIAALPLGLRHASLLWKLAGLALLPAAGAGGALIADRLYHASAARDASSFAEAELGQDGLLAPPRGAAGRGPLSQLYVTLLGEAEAERRAYLVAAARLNIGVLGSPYLLEQNPAVLGNCGAIGALKPAAEAQGRKDAGRASRLAAAIDASGLPEELRGGIRMMAVPVSEEGAKARLDAQNALLDATEALCRLLARRTWRSQYGLFAFASGADLAQFRAIEARRQQAAGALAAAQRDTRERMTQGREQVRELLSR